MNAVKRLKCDYVRIYLDISLVCICEISVIDRLAVSMLYIHSFRQIIKCLNRDTLHELNRLL